MDEVRKRVDEALKRLGIDYKAASKLVGKNDAYIQQYLKKGSPVRLPEDVRVKLARITNLTEQELGKDPHLYSEDVATDIDEDEEDFLDFAGPIEAGSFREVDDLDQRLPGKVKRMKDPRFLRARQYAFLVRGDSMDLKRIFDGMYVATVDYVDYRNFSYGDLRDGMLVVVERSEAEGSRRERTIKEIQLFRDRIELHPHSSNPKWEKIVIPIGQDPAKNDTARVLAVVLESFQLHR